MRKNVFGRQLKRDKNERKALFKSLMSALVLKERIKTTEEKAKAIRGQVEKLVTKAKKKGEAASSLLSSHLLPVAVEKMIKNVAPRFQNRPGGYTRIVKLGRRFGDNARMVLMEWTATTENTEKTSIESVVPGKQRKTVVARKTTRTKKITKKEA